MGTFVSDALIELQSLRDLLRGCALGQHNRESGGILDSLASALSLVYQMVSLVASVKKCIKRCHGETYEV